MYDALDFQIGLNGVVLIAGDLTIQDAMYANPKILLSLRIENCLVNDKHIITLRQLANKSERELLLIPNFGKACLREVKQLLAHFGLNLRGDHQYDYR